MPHPAPRPVDAALVAVGGAAGSLARAWVGDLLPHETGTWPWSTVLVNVVGSFALGVVLAVAVSSAGAARRVRLVVGTGVLGGFTTFSGFALDASEIARADRPVVSTAYVVTGSVTMVLGATAGWLVAGGRRHEGERGVGRDGTAEP